MRSQGGMVDEFSRLQGLFVVHLGFAVIFAWTTALFAASRAPWVHNIRALIDPAQLGRVESTGSFLFCLPLLLTLGWLSVAYGGDLLRRTQMLRNQSAEFALAALAAFTVFYMSVERAVTALMLGA